MRVSIVVCNYNYEAFVDGAIRSAVEQDHADKEIIVVDDGSTDGSRAIVEKWKGRIVPVYKDNGGQVSAYNAGFERVTGDVVIFLDSDDTLDPSACSTVVRAFSPGVAKVHYRLRILDAAGSRRGGIIPTRLAEGDLSALLRLRGELYDSAPGSGNAYRVETLRRLMPIPEDPSDRHGADFFTIYGISLLGSVRVAAARPLGGYRVHRGDKVHDLAFGNALPQSREPERTHRRYERARLWIHERLGAAYSLPLRLRPSFSLEKHHFANAVFDAGSYVDGLRDGAPVLVTSLLPSILRIHGSWAVRAGLTGWAVGVLLLPRPVGLRIARHVCNPASRGLAASQARTSLRTSP